MKKILTLTASAVMLFAACGSSSSGSPEPTDLVEVQAEVAWESALSEEERGLICETAAQLDDRDAVIEVFTTGTDPMTLEQAVAFYDVLEREC